MAVADDARALRDLLRDESCWVQGETAHDAHGVLAVATGPEAVSWCLYGAMLRVTDDDDQRLRELGRAIAHLLDDADDPPQPPLSLCIRYNDWFGTTWADVDSLLTHLVLSTSWRTVT